MGAEQPALNPWVHVPAVIFFIEVAKLFRRILNVFHRAAVPGGQPRICFAALPASRPRAMSSIPWGRSLQPVWSS